jgi:hypothetical protein
MNKKSIISLIITAISILIISCANGYKEFYQPTQGLSSEKITARRAAPQPLNPTIERAQPANGDKIIEAYAKRGYIMIGQSSFNSGTSQSEDSAVTQAREVGADLVLILNPQYTGSETSTVPITTPKTTTSFSTGTATAYSSSGAPITAYGNSVTTSYDTTTSYIPITVHRSDYAALYFVKQRFSLGVLSRELNDSERQLIQSNKGIAVSLVVDNTPAFHADILTGDIITEIDGTTISNPQFFSEYISLKSGKKVSINIIRSGKSLKKTIQLDL